MTIRPQQDSTYAVAPALIALLGGRGYSVSNGQVNLVAPAGKTALSAGGADVFEVFVAVAGVAAMLIGRETNPDVSALKTQDWEWLDPDLAKANKLTRRLIQRGQLGSVFFRHTAGGHLTNRAHDRVAERRVSRLATYATSLAVADTVAVLYKERKALFAAADGGRPSSYTAETLRAQLEAHQWHFRDAAQQLKSAVKDLEQILGKPRAAVSVRPVLAEDRDERFVQLMHDIYDITVTHQPARARRIRMQPARVASIMSFWGGMHARNLKGEASGYVRMKTSRFADVLCALVE